MSDGYLEFIPSCFLELEMLQFYLEMDHIGILKFVAIKHHLLPQGPPDSSTEGGVSSSFQVLKRRTLHFRLYIVKITWRISHTPHTQCPLLNTPFNITVIQVYALTNNAEEAEAEQFYEDLQDLIEQTPKKEVIFLIGDWNAKVRSQEILGVMGKFGLGVQNEAGQWLTEFCQENTLVLANTLLQQHRRRLYMWTSPDGQY